MYRQMNDERSELVHRVRVIALVAPEYAREWCNRCEIGINVGF